MTPLKLAKIIKRSDIVRILKLHGADIDTTRTQFDYPHGSRSYTNGWLITN